MDQTDRPRARFIEAYGGGGFRVDGEAHHGSIIVLPDRVEPWPVPEIGSLTLDSLQPVIVSTGAVEILLIGCGARFAMVPLALRRALAEAGLMVDAMDTGAACRTYNVLRSEERRVAAALITVG